MTGGRNTSANCIFEKKKRFGVRYEFQFCFWYFQRTVPRETGDSQGMNRVEFVFAEGHFAEIVENVGQKSYVQSQVVVVVDFHRLTVVTLPRLQCTIVIFLPDSFLVQFTVKLVSRRKTRFGQNFGTRDVLVRINTFLKMFGSSDPKWRLVWTNLSVLSRAMIETSLSSDQLRYWNLSKKRMLSICTARTCGYDLDFCVWIVQVFDDKVRVVRSCIVHEKGNERFITKFPFFQLQFKLLHTGAV